MPDSFDLYRCDDRNQGKSAAGLNGMIFFFSFPFLFSENVQSLDAKTVILVILKHICPAHPSDVQMF